MREFILDCGKILISAWIISLVLTQFILPTRVYGNSMEPSFSHHDYVLVNRQAYRSDKPERGDVIIFRSHLKDEEGEEKVLIKRVIAVGGDQVEVTQGKVYINGKELEEPYTLQGITNGLVHKVTVPEDGYFCLGDNRLHSTDSRHFEVGFVYEEDIIGKVFFQIYPFDQFGTTGDD